MKNIEKILEEIRKIHERMIEEYEEKNKLQTKFREIQRICGEAVTAIHRGKIEEAEEKIKRAEERIEIEKVKVNLKNSTLNSTVTTAIQEYVEAKSLLEIEKNNRLPTIDELEISEKAYILGLADLIGELRRRTLNHLIKGEIEKAKEKFGLMIILHQTLQQLEYPRSLIPGLRSKLDAMRRIIEDTEKIITQATISLKLYEKLKEIYDEKKLDEINF